jgi:hypothetical protein
MLVYFYLPENDDVYFDAPLVLAEGLKELGVEFAANRDYWRLAPDSEKTLFKKRAGLAHQDADVVIIHDDWFFHYPQSTLKIRHRPAPPDLFVPQRRYQLVYLDTWVGARTNSWEPEFRHCDLILRTQYNRRCSYPSNVRPWVLGFTERILQATSKQSAFQERRRVLLENFAYTHHFEHGVRAEFSRKIAPMLQGVLPVEQFRSKPQPEKMSAFDHLMWQQSVDKHNPDYFAALTSSAAVACFCGYLCPWWPGDASVHFRGAKRQQALAAFARGLAALVPRPPRLIQWDSWRFWETLCAGSVAFHLDLEHYGVELPVMPVNWKHYIGIDLDRPEGAIERLRDDAGLLERVARQGREWAGQHYSPVAMANRLRKWLS